MIKKYTEHLIICDNCENDISDWLPSESEADCVKQHNAQQPNNPVNTLGPHLCHKCKDDQILKTKDQRP